MSDVHVCNCPEMTEEEILEELKKTTDVDYILNTFTN